MKIIVQGIVSLLIMVTLIINNKKHDSRIAIFTKCYIAIDSVSIGLLFRKYNMIDIAWWERISHNEPKLKITDETFLSMKAKFVIAVREITYWIIFLFTKHVDCLNLNLFHNYRILIGIPIINPTNRVYCLILDRIKSCYGESEIIYMVPKEVQNTLSSMKVNE
jgi:hypothetical protein